MNQMALMDVVIVPSRFEGFGLSAAEAMAMGKPVIASELFGLKELVLHENTGFLFEPESVKGLRFYMSKILNEKKLIPVCGELGYERVVVHFSLEHFIHNTNHLYNRVLK